MLLPVEAGLTDFGICYLKNRALNKLDKAFIEIVREVDSRRYESMRRDS